MKDSIYHYLVDHPPAFELFKKLESSGNLYLIGGVLREYKDHHTITSLRDIDLIIDVKDSKRWSDAINSVGMRTNRFGGYKLFCQSLLIDIWPIEETWAFRNHIIKCSSDEYFQYLPKTVFLNIDGIIYDWQSCRWLDDEYQAAMTTRTIDVVLPQNPYIPLNILRAFVLKERYQLSLSSKLIQIISQEVSDSESLSQFANILYDEQLRRYKATLLSKARILELLHSSLD